jgi:hypothetical protein
MTRNVLVFSPIPGGQTNFTCIDLEFFPADTKKPGVMILHINHPLVGNKIFLFSP